MTSHRRNLAAIYEPLKPREILQRVAVSHYSCFVVSRSHVGDPSQASSKHRARGPAQRPLIAEAAIEAHQPGHQRCIHMALVSRPERSLGQNGCRGWRISSATRGAPRPGGPRAVGIARRPRNAQDSVFCEQAGGPILCHLSCAHIKLEQPHQTPASSRRILLTALQVQHAYPSRLQNSGDTCVSGSLVDRSMCEQGQGRWRWVDLRFIRSGADAGATPRVGEPAATDQRLPGLERFCRSQHPGLPRASSGLSMKLPCRGDSTITRPLRAMTWQEIQDTLMDAVGHLFADPAFEATSKDYGFGGFDESGHFNGC